VKRSMNPEINDETRLRKRVNCSLELHDSRQLRDNFTLVQSIAHTSFSNLLNTDNCGFASLLAKCGPSYGPLRCFTDVQFSTQRVEVRKRNSVNPLVAAQGHQLQYDGLQSLGEEG
jgi:hypothetical protein